MAEQSYSEILKAVIGGTDLSREQVHWAFCQIMDGQWTETQVGGILVALAAKGETIDEIAGAAQAMREHAVRINTGGQEVIDIVGTGGTGLSTFNISTTTSMVCAGAGVKVAKHGNRTNTRASGSANVLAELGVNLDADGPCVSRCLAEANVCFCFAVKCHPAMKHAVPARKQLGVRTIFNVLGPLTNPAGAKRQLMGVFNAALTEPLANVLGALGADRVMVVHSDDGLDEFSHAAATQVSELIDGQVNTRKVRPEDFGIQRGRLEDIFIESPRESAKVAREVLSGAEGAPRDIVTLNAAAALMIAGKAATIKEGVALARQSIDSGAALTALDKLIEVSNS
ncbi:MAG: anthranilate phosphoribosyltransferase [Planctomycetes bacterium]|nr:anthranilate phosphoribosyltransferase [Planctomycetota bacterium]